MKIAVFGATGGTGIQVVEQALANGYQVIAFARSLDKLKVKDENTIPFEGDIQDSDEVAAALEEVKAVISVLGPTDNRSQFVVSLGIYNILAGMMQHRVSRLVMSAGAGVHDPGDSPNLINKFFNVLLRTFSKNIYEDMVNAVRIVRESDVDWTIVRVPMLTDGPKTGKIQVAWVGKGMGMRVSRADLAFFMLSQVEDYTYIHQAPAISY